MKEVMDYALGKSLQSEIKYRLAATLKALMRTCRHEIDEHKNYTKTTKVKEQMATI